MSIKHRKKSDLVSEDITIHNDIKSDNNQIEYEIKECERTSSAPLYEALLEYKRRDCASFHVPGHKNGQAYTSSDGAGLLSDIMRIDVTEITGTDDLHHPEGIIREAQSLAAKCFGAEESYFLIGGSTVGNLALILTVCSGPEDVLLVQRNVHKSVLHGLMLAGAQAVFMQPEIDPVTRLAIAPSNETVKQALLAYPEAKGVLVTMPNYYGMGRDLTSLADLCHGYNVPLLVDEAHGAHFGQHLDLPPSALSCGADGVVQSTHKMLAALTMGAMLHVQGMLLDRTLLRQRLAMIQSSSPSYPVMASLDLARRQLHVGGADTFTAGLAAVEAFKRGLAELPRFGLLQPAQPGETPAGEDAAGSTAPPLASLAAYATQDPFKVVIYDDSEVLSGYELQRRLEACGCIPEMSDARYVVLLFSLGSTMKDVRHLLEVVQHISIEMDEAHGQYERGSFDSNTVEFSTWNIFSGNLSLPVPFGLKSLPTKMIEPVLLEECAGRIAAEMIIPYPPGIPILYAGEEITSEVGQQLMSLAEAGAKCQGAADPDLHTVNVYKKVRKQEK
ncbi:aminotransferase class I/II-fold pyridoxal phosphate-dependent enzyme [Paenibacillus sp. IHBB 10380]|uniref:aminotransferase class I/II-fold pyridoxal phosphate-dependent enzyme n=1 Tax=Paenibacillus sp. IHBB 10380 TaxID=1566358 RepID=UPI0009E5A357|nr:aminotransferase class I/II-fold pyridoxal phosphate-dependent enzyme [Paenibacillus sp. IHBB 10380]